ncbi:hypothetical protein QCG29_000068 [Clostridioides difficile]|nr:hypothetical protein [Clostridioides difficile]
MGNKFSVPFWVFCTYIVISLFIFWYLLLKLFNNSNSVSEIFCLNIIRFYEVDNNVFCMLKPCDNLPIGTYLTLYYIEDEIEKYLATCKVSNIQNNKLISIDLLTTLEEGLNDKIINNNVDFLKSIIIKPIVTSSYIDNK